MIFVVCNEKGGAGKSSISQNLSVWLMLEKSSRILLVDGDPQRTSAEWAEEREESDYPRISCIQLTGNIAQNLVDQSENYDHVIVDCGGADSKAMLSALTVADIAVIPTRAKRRDLRQLPSVSDRIETAQAMNKDLKVFSVVTQAPTLPSQGYRIQNAKKLMAALGLNPIIHTTRMLNAWDDAEESGGSVFEYEDKKAADDASAVFSEILEAAHG